MQVDRSNLQCEIFADLNGGDVFEHLGRVFLRLAVPPGYEFNCADLESGMLGTCEDNATVVPLPDAELTL